MDLEIQLRNLQLNEDMEKSEVNLMNLPTEILVHVASFISSNKLKIFGLVNKKCQEIHHHVWNKRLTECVDLRKFYYLNEKKMLERVKDLNYRRVNLNQCYNLSSSFILELVSKESIRELDLIECQCTAEVIAAIAQLNLTSLSICLSSQWRSFFVSNKHNSVSFLNKLTKLEIFHWNNSKQLMCHVSRYVLPHCPQLRSLKLFTMPVYFVYRDESEKSFERINLIPSSVPKLENLILDFHNYDDLYYYIYTFLDIILYEKKIPLTNVYLGKQTFTLFYSGHLRRENLSFENSDTFCLSRSSNSFQSLHQPDICECRTRMFDPMLKSTKFNKIFMENRSLGNLSDFLNLFLKCTAIKEISFRGSAIDIGLSNFITGISSFNSGITLLDISLGYWSPATEETNPSLIKSIANLTNLRNLYMVASMLRHTKSDKDALKQSFLEVTNKCTLLKDFRIVDDYNKESIRQDVLSLIKFFKNLKKLHLVNFTTIGKEAVLPEIVKSCTKLKYLHVENIGNEKKWEEMLIHAKLLKHLRLDQRFGLTKGFVDNLSRCTQLEKVCLSGIDPEEYPEVIRYLGHRLKKLNKLQVFSSLQWPHIDNRFRTAMDEIKEKRPSFFFNDFSQRIPLAHHEFLQGRLSTTDAFYQCFCA